MSQDTQEIQALVGDRYTLLEQIGQGGFALVHRALQVSTGQIVAVKVLRSIEHETANERARRTRRIRRELEICARLSHPHIVRLVDSGESSQGVIFAVFEHVAGRSLEEVLQQEGPLAPSTTRRLMGQVLDALCHAHRFGVIHRDLKPANIMISAPGSRPHAMVLDYGLGMFAEPSASLDRITLTREAMGTPRYAAPEQLRGELVTPSADLYSWALVFIEALTGRPAIRGNSLQEILHAQLSDAEVMLPPDLAYSSLGMLLRRALAKSPERRRVNVEQLIDALDRVRDDDPGSDGAQVLVSLRLDDETANDEDVENLHEAAARVAAASQGVIHSALAGHVLLGFSQRRDAEAALARGLHAALDVSRHPVGARLRIAVEGGVLPESGRLIGPVVAALLDLGRATPLGRVALGAGLAEEGRAWVHLERELEGRFGGWLVLAPARTGGPVAELARAEPEMSGRRSELALIAERWEQAREGRGQVVAISGEPGIGKSRLVRGVYQHPELADADWIEAGCTPEASGTPFAALAEWLRELASADRGAPRPETAATADRLNALAADFAIDLAPVAVGVAAILGEQTQTPARERSPESDREAAFEALIRLFVAVADRTPSVLLLEDMQWCDASSLAFVDALRAEVPATRMLLLCTYRSHFQPGWPSSEHTMQLPLGPINRRDLSHLVHARLGGVPDARLVGWLLEKTGGNALFVEELLASAREQGALVAHESGFTLGDASEWKMPATLDELARNRIEELGEARSLLQWASVVGMETSSELLSVLEAGPIGDQLARIETAGLLRRRGGPPDTRYAFKHALIRDAAYRSLTASERRAAHRKLHALLASDVSTTPEQLARHAELGEMYEDAVNAWFRAGSAAAQQFAHVEAVEHLTSSGRLVSHLPLPQRDARELDIQVALCSSIGPIEGFASDRLGAALARARELCHRTRSFDSLTRVLHGMARMNQSRARFDDAIRYADEVIGLSRDAGDVPGLLSGELTRAFTLTYTGRFERAAGDLTSALEDVDAAGGESLMRDALARENLASARAWLSYNEGILGRVGDSLARNAEWIERARAQKLMIAELLAMALQAETWRVLGDVHAAHTLAEVLIERAGQRKLPFWSGIGRMIEGDCLVRFGEVSRGLALAQSGLEIWDGTGARHGRSQWLALLAETSMAADERAAAHRIVEEGIAAAAKTGEKMCLADLLRLRAELALDCDRAAASDAYLDAWSLALEQKAGLFALRTAISAHEAGVSVNGLDRTLAIARSLVVGDATLPLIARAAKS